MAALCLHNALFTSESDKRLATPITRILSLTTIQEHNPTSLTFNSPAYLDLLSRQPLHPDGPRHWDLGLDLIGDPITAAECKSLEDRITKAKLRRLQRICVAFEVVLGIWSIYCTIRYSLAFQTTSISSVRTLALVLCITSAVTVAGVVVTLFMPLLPEHVFVRASSHTRMTLRGCCIVLIVATAITNLVFVLIWRPVDRCGWDMDVAWSTFSTMNSTSPHCRTATLAAWTIAASLRVIATLIMILLYLYFLKAYLVTRHPSKYTREMYYPPLMASDDTVDSPVSTLDPSASRTRVNHLIRSTTALGLSSSTLALTNSSTTLAPTLSPSSQSHSHPSMLATQAYNPASSSPQRSRRIWPNWTSLRLSGDAGHQRQNGRSDTPHTLRRKSRISSEHISRNADIPDAWEECTEVYAVAPGAASRVPGVPSPLCATDKCSIGGRRSSSMGTLMTESDDCGSVYSYGYGATEPAYPYLEVYNPSIERNYNLAPPANVTQQPRLSAAVIPATFEPASLLTATKDYGVEDELIPIMGGFVRRMSTIESFGSREAATSMTRSYFSRYSGTLASHHSSLGLASCAPSIESTLSRNNSLGTAYFSVSSETGGSSVKFVNERGELEAKTTSPPSYSRYYYTRDDHYR
ncbi:uncharacterized protein EDB91DRAFT_1151335 [Suillus paluster]|uniref:uncharacterized protein n=1 Tax=Suillus paluster TaxID=48578 RepID=UPI001B878C62|nr:uncharacterized protein EDB91DRAFT_1151335 [Suillus paluster]KAG1732658.1 hypothetical protein EDB91DRAFT_1151335 [Suillus paluster]